MNPGEAVNCDFDFASRRRRPGGVAGTQWRMSWLRENAENAFIFLLQEPSTLLLSKGTDTLCRDILWGLLYADSLPPNLVASSCPMSGKFSTNGLVRKVKVSRERKHLKVSQGSFSPNPKPVKAHVLTPATS